MSTEVILLPLGFVLDAISGRWQLSFPVPGADNPLQVMGGFNINDIGSPGSSATDDHCVAGSIALHVPSLAGAFPTFYPEFWDMMNADNQSGGIATYPAPVALSRLQGWNGAGWDRVLTTGGALHVTGGGGFQWSLTNAPAAATVATVTQPAAAGVRHVCQSISAFCDSVGAGPRLLVLRDGATGVGAILWSRLLQGVTGACDVPGLNIVGTAGNAMTLEFTTAPTGVQSVALAGIDA